MNNRNKLIICIISALIIGAIIITSVMCDVKRTEDELTTDEEVSYESESDSEIMTEATYETEETTTKESTTMTTTKEHITNPIVASTTKVVTTTKEAATEETTSKSQDNNTSFFYLSDYERRIAECVVMGEAGNESYEGQVLVAQCILNACTKDGLQPSQVRSRYQYSGWNSYPNDSVKRAVSAVFDDGYNATHEKILYFYAPEYCSSPWHESQRFVREVGGHRFFAEW